MPALPVAGAISNAATSGGIKLSGGLIAGIAAGGLVVMAIIWCMVARFMKECCAKRKEERQERCLLNECPWYHRFRASHAVSLRDMSRKSCAGSESELEDLGCNTNILRGLPQTIDNSGDYLKVARGSFYRASCPDLRDTDNTMLETTDPRLKGIKKRAKSIERRDRSPPRINSGSLPLVDSSCPADCPLFVKRLIFQARFREPPPEELASTLFPGRNTRNPRRESETLTPQQAHARTMLMQEEAIKINIEREKETAKTARESNGYSTAARRHIGNIDLNDNRSIHSSSSGAVSILQIIEQGRVLKDDVSVSESPTYALTPRDGESSCGVVGNDGMLSRTSSNGGATVVPGESAGESAGKRGVFVTTFHPVENRYTL